ncbi:methyl-accepting chemotaxis protein [Natrialba swarupiae]|uniref:Chemotaxis protein n=1 Tax=Natrialba swarupiae TaxID=2448032 RepID=A0A5D5AL53_9EURY|nr:HAMP domain-containing methyl-accepting chemotaxis protein [Natrialba swarupiae]TYT62489.1 chemotaxis protein [Natrialba swarupiae]
MTAQHSSTGSTSPLPAAIQTDRPFGFGVVIVLVGVAVATGVAFGLGEPATPTLAAGVGGVVATGFIAILIASVSDAKSAPQERDELRTAVAELCERTTRLEDGDHDVEFETDRSDVVADLATDLASIRDRLEESERTDRTLSDLERTVGVHADVTRSVADGDLTERFDPEGSHDVIGDLARNSNEMLAEIEETFSTLKSFSGEVVTYSRELNMSIETVRAEGERTREALSTVADDTDEQNEQLRSATAEMESLSTTIEEIAATASEVADTADETARVGQDGGRSASDAIEGMAVIEEETERAVAEIEALEDEAERIDGLIDSISGIAEQTNMLALNANIEASRSTQGGEGGFTAVADEIQNLSEEVYDSVKDVEERLEGLRTRALSAADEVRRSRERIEGSVDDVEDAAEALERIADLSERTNEGIQEISAATQQQAASTEEVVAMVEGAAETSDETALSAQRAARRASAQADALSHVAHSATVLADQSGQLNRHLERYDTERGYDLPEARAADDVDPEAVSTAEPTPETIPHASDEPR